MSFSSKRHCGHQIRKASENHEFTSLLCSISQSAFFRVVNYQVVNSATWLLRNKISGVLLKCPTFKTVACCHIPRWYEGLKETTKMRATCKMCIALFNYG